MLRIGQVKMPIDHNKKQLTAHVCELLHILPDEMTLSIRKRSVDARKKNDLHYVYAVDVSLRSEKQEEQILKRNKKLQISKVKETSYQLQASGQHKLRLRPVIVGSGPAGLFCAYELARIGFSPIILERGKTVDKRLEDVDDFWKNGVLKPDSNVQFGEGGAGTFSDGKLNTMVKDPLGRSRHVLETFVKFGAPEEILYDAKPHIGTDILTKVIQNMRHEVIHMGGSFYFETTLTDLRLSEDGQSIAAVVTQDQKQIDTNVVVLAIGHSARDTFEMLDQKHLHMEPKAFAVGFRVEHPQSMINESQYGTHPDMEHLPVAPYKVTANFPNHRGVYSFCMCPGGFVVNASSEEGRLAINGMSYSKRDSANANSAIIVSVTPDDFPDQTALGGVRFQRKLEEKAYALANGKIPQQLFGDFKQDRVSKEYGSFKSCVKGATAFANLRGLLSEEMNDCLIDGMKQFGRKIAGFDREDAILSGIESRTSSPLRMIRDEQLESNIKGLYPCGEGAGYAGGITSAAMDGMRIAEAIAAKYQVCYTGGTTIG